MPLTRYQIRNEYSLADPELYKAADRDDPEALLEGVAMAGLVGVLRQLGDLAEFAAEIFHDLHEDVMATAARGHGLMVRVQQLEAEFPSIERAFLSQTNHSLFFINAGVDWHPNLHMEQNLITRGALPRCVMDSYEECRSPPRLFLLDKFDVAGAGACLKRFTDPSFFKVEAALSEIPSLEIQREKKIRKLKKKGSHWRNGETPEIVPTSHAKLHQLFLEERIEKGHNDPARIVKLKKRQLNASPFDSRSGKSYMEKFLEITPEQNLVRDISVTPLPLKMASDNSSESGLEIHDVSAVSPMKRSSRGNESTRISPDAHEVVLKPSMDELYDEVIDRQIVKVPEPSAADERDETPSSLHTVTMQKEIVVDEEGKMDASVDGDNSDDMTSEVDNYMDALTTMGLEMETYDEYRPKTGLGFSNVEKCVMVSDGNGEKPEFQAHSSDSQSIGNFSASDDGNSSFKIGRSSFSYSDTLSNLAENVPSDGEGSSGVFLSSEASVTQITVMPSNWLPADAGILGTKSHDLVLPNDMSIDEDNTGALGKASTNSSLIDSNPPLLALDLVETSLHEKLDETPSGTMKSGPEFSLIYGRETNLDDSLTAISDVLSLTRDFTLFTDCDKCHPVDKLDAGDPNISSDDLLHLSNNSELAPEEKSSNDSHNEKLKTDFAEENCPENMVNNKIGSPHSIASPTKDLVPCSALLEVEVQSSSTLFTDSSDAGKPYNVVSNVDDAFLETGGYLENSTSMVNILQNCSFKGQQVTDTVDNIPQGELDLAEREALYSEEAYLAGIPGPVDGEKMGVSTSKVEATEGDVDPFELPSNRTDSSVPEDHVVCDDFVAEGVQAESINVSSTVTHDVPAVAPAEDDIDTVVHPSPYIICSRSKDTVNLRESPGIVDPHVDRLELNDLVSRAHLRGSEAENKMTQLEVATKDFDSAYNLVSYDESNLEMVQGVNNLSLAEMTQKRLPAGDFTIAAASSELNGQEMESNCLHHGHFLEDGDNCFSLPTAPFPDVDIFLEQLLQLQADQLDVEFMKGEASSDSAIHPSKEIQSSDGTNLERLFSDASESCQEDLLSRPSPSECLQQSAGQVINNTKPGMDPLASIFPSFGLLHEAAQVNLEEMPPLPPLPPVQWRTGKIQHASLFSQREFFDRSQESCPSIFPFGDCEKGQSGFPSQQGDILQPVNPFLPVSAVEVEKLHVPQREVDNEMQPTLSSLQFPSLASDANCQKNCVALEGTQLLNPFLTLSALTDEKPEYDCLASEHEEAQASSNPFLSLPGIEDASSKHGHVSSPEKLIQHLNELEPEPGLEGKLFQGTSEGNPSDTSALPAGKFEEQLHRGLLSSEGKTLQQSREKSEVECRNPSDTSELPPGKVEKQPQHGLPSSEGTLQCTSENSEGECGNPSDTSALPPGMVEEQLQHVLPSSEGESAWSSNPFALLPTSEVGKVNGSSTVKLSCPWNPPEGKTFQGTPEWSHSDTSALPAGKFEEQPHPGLPSSEGKTLQQTPENSEDERGNPSDTSALPPGKVEKQPQHVLPSSEGTLQCISESSEGECGNPSDTFVLPPGMVEQQFQHVLPSSGGESSWSYNPFARLPTSEVGKVNGSSIVKLPRPRNPLIDAVVALDKSKLRKVTERVWPQIGPKIEERDSLLEEIRSKSFNLKPAALSRTSITGPKTNLKVAAILEKANAIRQATAGSDEDDDEDWSDS